MTGSTARERAWSLDQAGSKGFTAASRAAAPGPAAPARGRGPRGPARPDRGAALTASFLRAARSPVNTGASGRPRSARGPGPPRRRPRRPPRRPRRRRSCLRPCRRERTRRGRSAAPAGSSPMARRPRSARAQARAMRASMPVPSTRTRRPGSVPASSPRRAPVSGPPSGRRGPTGALGAWLGPSPRPAAPGRAAGWTMSAPADRGLWSPKLWRRIRRLGQLPLLRIQRRTTITPDGRERSRPGPWSVPGRPGSATVGSAGRRAGG